MEPDWLAWHREYRDPSTKLSERLQIVQQRIRETVDAAQSPQIRIISICAGQGHDVLGALAEHPRADAVRARLVEIDSRSVEMGRVAAETLQLPGVEFICGDASVTDAYAGAVPAQLVVCCGVFGNISLDDVRRAILHFPQLCAQDGIVIWTRHRRDPDVTPEIRQLFTGNGFSEVSYDETERFGVGVERLTDSPQPFKAGQRLFQFGSGLWANRA